MATGTGKTITSLQAAEMDFNKKGRQFLIIIVPYLHLIPQWANDFKLINISTFLEISGNRKSWIAKLDNLIWDYNNNFRNRVVVIGSYKSMASIEFQDYLCKIKDDRFLIADECHNIGSPSFYKNNFNKCESRLGLSATPRRWWDDKGTDIIYDLFHKPIYSYSMDEAISQGFLTEYYYYPKITELSDDEIEDYSVLTKKIGLLMAKEKKTSEDIEKIKNLLISRGRILQNAKAKLSQLINLLRKKQDHRFTLVYCGDGEIDKVIQAIAALGIRVSRFNSELNPKDRQIVLKQFSQGKIEVLVAIKCLDEGVDVPATRTAYFLASTSNPRQFVQRRGRILRKHKNKVFSEIYDFIVLPDRTDSYNIFKSIAEREMPRFAEFSSSALNKYQSRDLVRKKLSKYHLEEYLDLLPWEIYQRRIDKMEEN